MGRVITRVALIGPVCCGQNQGALVRKDKVLAKGMAGGTAPLARMLSLAYFSVTMAMVSTLHLSGAELFPSLPTLPKRPSPKASFFWFPSLSHTPPTPPLLAL